VALDEAAAQGHLAILKFWWKKSWPVQEDFYTNSFLRAVGYGQSNIVRFLLSKGANPNTGKDTGETALALAAQAGHPEIVRILLDAGADINAPVMRRDYDQRFNDFGRTPLMVAIHYGRIEVVKLLLKHHANDNYKSPTGETALGLAKRYKQTHILQMLKQAGAKE